MSDQPKATQTSEVFISTEKWNENIESLSIPSHNSSTVKEAISNSPVISTNDSQESREWSKVLKESVETTNIRDVFQDSLNREGADYRQAIDSEKYPLCAGVPNLRYNEGEKVSGMRAVNRVRSLLGLGTVVQIPLWHSGFWITIKAPSESSLLELQRRLIESKVNLGRSTHGLIFANTSSYIANWLVDFVIAHTYDTTLKNPEINLKKYIRVLDLPTVIWGLATTIWPNGFQYARACVADPEKCKNVEKEKINLNKLLWPDRSQLTEWQISHMANRSGSSMSDESVQRYQDEFLIGKGRKVEITSDISINLKVPSIEEYLVAGNKWIEAIIQQVDGTLAEDDSDIVRDIAITQLGKASSMRQYVHWIESIDAGGSIIDDNESIEQVIDSMSVVDDVRTIYYKEIIKYINDSTMAVIAIPAFTCPKCGGENKSDLPRFPNLIPIDVMSSFFTLLVQMLARINQR